MSEATNEERREAAAAMDEAWEKIVEAMNEIRDAGRASLSETDFYRLERGVLSHIEMALSNDHQFLGGNMFTLQETINALNAPCESECCSAECEAVEDGDHYVCTQCGELV